VEQNSGCELYILYAGHELNKNYIAYLSYGEMCHEKHLGKAWIWNISRIARPRVFINMIVTETEEGNYNRFSKSNDYYLPCWIDGEIDISQE
jgi:hypothetical protein